MTDLNQQSFEQNMADLQQIVAQLEQGQIPLQQAIDQYKRGMELSQALHNQLAKAQKTLTQVIADNGEITTFKRDDLPDQNEQEK